MSVKIVSVIGVALAGWLPAGMQVISHRDAGSLWP
jgi:hypothetical protein